MLISIAFATRRHKSHRKKIARQNWILDAPHHRGRRFELARWFDAGAGLCARRDAEPNHPRHQPTAAPAVSKRTNSATKTSFKAKRKTRRATKRNSATATNAITPVVIAVTISIGHLSLGSETLRRSTAYCLLYLARTVVLMFPRTLKSPSISTLKGSHAFTKSSRMILTTCS